MTEGAPQRCQIMGIVNVTPDSFFPGSRGESIAAGIARAERLIAEGADIIDIGGESTRPGAEPVPHDVELARVIPVIEALAGKVQISIDTRHAPVAYGAVQAGATIINDVSASLEAVAAETGASWVAMHMRGTPQSMQDHPHYDDVVSEVLDFVVDAADRGRALGVKHIWIDPGIGFGKTGAHNLELMAGLDRFVASGYPLLLGVSRKRFIGAAHAAADSKTQETTHSEPLGPGERLEGSLALAAWGMMQNAAVLRVHDVAETVRCLETVTGGFDLGSH